MPDCPRCHQPVDAKAIACPYCRTPLKAYGHPGITLHRSTDGASLCVSCVYHADDTCTFPQRPHAVECTLYTDLNKPQPTPQYQPGLGVSFRHWAQRNAVWLALVSLIFISLWLAMSNR
jgi:hypothetical protein